MTIGQDLDATLPMTADEMAAELSRRGWRVYPPLTQDNCPHRRKLGGGQMNVDGSGYTEFYCPDCGKSGSHSWPAAPKFSDQIFIWN